MLRLIHAQIPEVRGGQWFLLLGGTLYPLWWGVVRVVSPDSIDPLWQRSAVGAVFLIGLAATFVSGAAARHTARLFEVAAWMLTLHYFYLLHENPNDSVYVFGGYVVVMALSAAFTTRASMLSYAALVVAGAIVSTVLHPNLMKSIFLPGLVTMLIMAAVSLDSRLKVGRAREDLLRAQAEKDAAHAAVRLREDFLHIAGHELKTPITAMLLQVQSLQRQLRNPSPDLARMPDRIDKAAANLKRLNRLVEELLDVSRLTAGRLLLHLEEVDIGEVLAEVADRFEDQRARSGSTLAIEAPPGLCGRWDRMRIDQVMTNLFGNAIKYGAGKPIAVTVTAPDDRVRVTIHDQGIGIGAEHHGRIFGRFERAVSDRNYGGLGLGLWIAHEIVQAHGGTIGFESTPGAGTTFFVELPRRGPGDLPGKSEEAAGPAPPVA